MSWLLDKTLEKQISELFDALVPAQGPAGTLEGEVIRAVSRIGYRYYNDGDMFFEGYGCETAGSCMAFLTECDELPKDFRCKILQLEDAAQTYTDYEVFLLKICEEAFSFVGSTVTPTNLRKSNVDMLEFEPNYIEDTNEECYDCGRYECMCD